MQRNGFRRGNHFLWDMDGIVHRGDWDIKRQYRHVSRRRLKRELRREIEKMEG